MGRGGIYLLTWTTHGTWLPGDDRGFVSRVPSPQGRVLNNAIGTPHDRARPEVAKSAASRLQGTPIWLRAEHVAVIEAAFCEAALNARFRMHAFAILRGHCHVVAGSPDLEGSDVLQRFKGVSSRRLTQAFGMPNARSWWTEGGSHRLLPSPKAVTDAIRYVLQQENALSIFDADVDSPPSRGLQPAREGREDTPTPPDAGTSGHS